ncbi:MAG: ABC-2 family transporter protein [Clostridia bacterium]|nr:ABC-2 family transporter protein [Clostridia bacterium]
MRTLKLYLHSMGMLLRAHTQYRASFALQTLAQLVMEGGEMMAVLLVVNRFERLGHWSGGNLLFFFGVMSLTFYLTEFLGRGVTGAFPSMVRSGQLDTLLVRPRGLMTQVLCAEIDPRRIGCLAVGLTALILGSRASGIRWTLPKALALLEAVGLGTLLTLGLFLIECVLCVYTVRSIEMVNALTYGGRSACQYPVDIYPRPLRILFTAVAPYALVLHVPAAWILDKPLWNWPAWTAFVTPLAGPLVFLVMRGAFGVAMRHYRSTGS